MCRSLPAGRSRCLLHGEADVVLGQRGRGRPRGCYVVELGELQAVAEVVFVEPDHRNLGVGRALLECVKEWAKEKGADGVSLQVAAANERGRKFYEELGFREVSVYEVLEF